MITYGRHHPEIRLTIPPCRKPIPLRALRVSGTTWPKIVLLRAPPGPRLCARVCLGE